MESCFVRFKNHVRFIKEKETRYLNKFQPLCESAQKRLDAPKDLFAAIENRAYWEELAKKRGYKSVDAIQTDVLSEVSKVKEEMDICKQRIVECNNMLEAFANDRATGYIEDFAFFLNVLLHCVEREKISAPEATTIFGSAIYANNKLAKKATDDGEKAMFKLLASYFDSYGKFQKSGGSSELFSKLSELLLNYPGYIIFELEEVPKYSSYNFFLEISDLYSKFLDNLAKEKMVVSSQAALAVDASYSASLKEYYRNGKLVKIPDDLSSFVELLNQNAVSENEQRHILSLIAEALNEDKNAKLAGFYQDDDQEVIDAGNRFLDDAKNHQGFYYEIKEILGEIQTLESMYIDATSLEDKNYIIQEKTTFLARLRQLIVPEVEMEPLNIAFLSDTDGTDYFAKDLEAIDKGIRKRVGTLFSKITSDNRRNFRKAYASEPIGMELYEVVNPDLHIIFTEIPGNIFMIIGVATNGNGYREITNRLVNKQNRDNLEAIVKAIKDDDVKRKYLLEQNGKIPSFTDKRTRK